MTMIEKQYKKLALAVLDQAIYDATQPVRGKMLSENQRDDALVFLDNYRMLGFYADIADVRGEMEKAGFIKKDLIKQIE